MRRANEGVTQQRWTLKAKKIAGSGCPDFGEFFSFFSPNQSGGCCYSSPYCSTRLHVRSM